MNRNRQDAKSTKTIVASGEQLGLRGCRANLGQVGERIYPPASLALLASWRFKS